MSRQDDVRVAIASAALRAFLRQGFDETTVDEIAAAAGVSRRTYFRYFSSKDEVLLGAIVHLGSEIADAARAQDRDRDPLTAIRDGIVSVVDRYDEDPARSRALSRLIRANPRLRAGQLLMMSEWTDELAEVVAARRGQTTVDDTDRMVATMAIGAYDLAAQRWLSDDRAPIADHVRAAFHCLARVCDGLEALPATG